MKHLINVLLISLSMAAAAQQINIPRVDEMPDLPQPYLVRDWHEVARLYDSLVFDLDASGPNLPLATVFENTVNYPAHPALAIQSYVGTNSPPGMEAINVLPAVVGATLVGIDKSVQNGINWALYCEEYFNRRPSENVYLNGPQSSSGNDWWYETMPNIFFYQLNYFYPNTGDFDYQVATLADRWLEAVYALDGSITPWTEPYMNYRAFKLSTMMPRTDGVKQPEAAGAIAWILYQAYNMTGNEKYRVGAELSMDFLSDWDQNPSYEMQLPYGVYAAARMNAELGTQYDIDKMINWCFDRGDLRGWGVITESWSGMDMDGLIGEVNAAAPDYVFHMNSLEHVGALVPMTRYDDRYATAIAKWVLNVANASRFYYPEFLPEDMQDNYDWSAEYDPNSAIAYEALREKPEGPFGTGDAMGGGWAETNLGLYGSSHVGILGGIISETNIEGVLQLDLLATDYYRDDAFQTYLYFNPHDETMEVEIAYEGTRDIYDAITNQVVATGANGLAMVEIQPKTSLMAVLIPADAEISYQLNHALVDGVVIDYNAGQVVNNFPPRIRALAAADTVALWGSDFTFYCTAEDIESDELQYEWIIDGELHPGNDSLVWQVPEVNGFYQIKCTVTDAAQLTASDSLLIKVVEEINYPPVIQQLNAENQLLNPSSSTMINCLATDANNDTLTYNWSAAEGEIQGSGPEVTFVAPADETELYVICKVEDSQGAAAADSLLILVREDGQGQTGELVAHYLFGDNVIDATGNGHNGTTTNCIFVEDMFGQADEAIKLNTSASKVVVDNQDDLNFRDGLTVSYWLNISEFYDRESYPVSHGNWTTRWKTSITGQHLRFTLNGTSGTIDVDAGLIFETGTWYHVAAIYNGQDCLVFINGELQGFSPYSGLINTTSYDLVIGQSLPDQTGFNYNGLLDNMRIYNYGIPYPELREIYEGELSEIAEIKPGGLLHVYPNPAHDHLFIDFYTEPAGEVMVTMISVAGQKVFETRLTAGGEGRLAHRLDVAQIEPGIYILRCSGKSGTISRKVAIE